MGKQPYIPLYIGDWEQDTNCLSLEAEGAWLKVVFKCWKNGGKFATNQESLCNLWKVSPQKFASILLELKTNNICDFEPRGDGSIVFVSRRLVREAEISLKRASSGSKGGSKTQAKLKQNPDSDNDNEVDIEVENTNKTGVQISLPIDIGPTFEIFWDTYDKKVDRVACEKKWDKISVRDRDSIMQHLIKYIPATADDKQFRKHPATYLNNRSWENEIILSTNGKNGGLTAQEKHAGTVAHNADGADYSKPI